MDEIKNPDEEWTKLPGGWIKERREGYDFYRPVSLPHNRRLTQASFSARFWVSVWALMMSAAIVLLWYFA